MFRLLSHPSPAALRARARGGTLALALVVLVLAGACSAATGDSKTSSNAAASSAPSRGEAGSAAAPAAVGQDAGAGGSGLALPEVDATRSVIRTGSMDLEVRSVTDAIEAARQIATAAGGSVSDSSFTGDRDHQSASLILRVPTARFAEVITQLQKMAAQVRTVTTNSRDVTQEVTDVEATLRNLRAVETQYQQLLSRAGSIGDVLQVQDRLNQTRLQIDRTEARRQSLASQTDMATLTVSLRPVTAASGTGLPGRINVAWAASLQTLDALASAVLMGLVFLWWVWPIAGVIAWIVIRQMRRAPKTALKPSTPADTAGTPQG